MRTPVSQLGARGGAEHPPDAGVRRHAAARRRRRGRRHPRLDRARLRARARGLQVAVVEMSQTGGHIDGYLRGRASRARRTTSSPTSRAGPPYLVDGPTRCARRARDAAGGRRLDQALHHRRRRLGARRRRHARVHDRGDRGRRLRGRAQGQGRDGARVRRRGPRQRQSRAGVRTIEHGIFLTEEQAELMAARRAARSSRRCRAARGRALGRAGRHPAGLRRAQGARPRDRLGGAVELARAHGIKIALGSDFVRRELHGHNLAEIPLLQEAGLTLEETLLAATSQRRGDPRRR